MLSWREGSAKIALSSNFADAPRNSQRAALIHFAERSPGVTRLLMVAKVIRRGLDSANCNGVTTQSTMNGRYGQRFHGDHHFIKSKGCKCGQPGRLNVAYEFWIY